MLYVRIALSFILLGVLIVCIQIGLGKIVIDLYSTWAIRGQVGDMFGVVNCLFSGLAFGGIILAVIMQKQELEMQRIELKLQRDQFQKSAEAQLDQARAQEKQIVELSKAADAHSKQAEALTESSLISLHTTLATINHDIYTTYTYHGYRLFVAQRRSRFAHECS